MTKFTIKFYNKNNGESPAREFVLSSDVKMRAKLLSLMEILEEYGNHLREPYSKHLEDGIFELRGKVGSNMSRIMYFFYHNKTIIITNGFIKKTQKIPKSEIDRAKRYRLDYIERCKKR